MKQSLHERSVLASKFTSSLRQPLEFTTVLINTPQFTSAPINTPQLNSVRNPHRASKSPPFLITSVLINTSLQRGDLDLELNSTASAVSPPRLTFAPFIVHAPETA